MTHQPVTVDIPTGDRPDTLKHCLRTVLNQDYPALLAVVSDNDIGSDTTAVIERFNCARIRHVRNGDRISMTHNFELGINHVTGGWITVLGEDDGLLGCYRVRDADGLTIEDVHGATLVAETIRAIRPSQLWSVASTAANRRAV